MAPKRRSGNLTDPNMTPEFLCTLTRVGYNAKVCKPSAAAIKAKYYEKFRGLDDNESDGAARSTPGSSASHAASPP